ncbi:MAG: cytochrome c [Flavobacteriales bacterium]|jgi:cytochrome c|uniref:c-type cytochrome n=1 Tax=Candidatus Ulvibacter alkanivorans TaxID=2267620 RepID=UPI000DF4400C|nr:cytochrome c [Candidatus Ulvibacter alkanivorans]MCH2489364.1 cytochrome c [Flavobacteriales bacterium]
MRTIIKIAFLLTVGILISCGGKEEKKEEKIKIGQKPKVEKKVEEPATDEVPASQRITLDNKGVGKIKEVKLDETIDQAMVERGAQIFKTNCTACHKIDKRFIGPSPKGILKRRSPEWIMNMILDPELMVAEDRCAKDLLVEFNGAAMANQNMTEAQARDILEYFRTL